ncbi:hypothetical protein ARAM_001920 [Aspergillus rambellii]|uniref:Uncharacterized protein n=1 Tax=Aspergillus rambellii TaxID=308745 RepID=A0A0F8U6A8_9EURO|nr:hypothetical protein ARAM_001920 [Aspergillus rambellii]
MGSSENDNTQGQIDNLHISIVLGVGLGVVVLTIMCLILTLFINRRDRRPPFKGKKASNDKLRKLDAVSPTRTLEEWSVKAHGPVLPSENVDTHFTWYVTSGLL